MALEKDPMPSMPVNDVFRLVIIGQVEDCMTVNTFWYLNAKPIGSSVRADQLALHDLFVAPLKVSATYLLCVSAEWNMTSINVDVVTKPSLATLIVPKNAIPGQGDLGVAPNQTCVTIAKTTDWRGKHGRGRISVPAVARSIISGTVLSVQTDHIALAAQMQAPLSDAQNNFLPGLWASKQNKETLEWTHGWVPITTCQVRGVLGTCRRRKPGRGK